MWTRKSRNISHKGAWSLLWNFLGSVSFIPVISFSSQHYYYFYVHFERNLNPHQGPLAELVNVSCILSRHYDSAGSMCVLRKQKLNEANKRDANETGKRELKQSGRRLTPYLELRNGRFQARLTLRSGRRAESSASLLSSSHSSKYSGVVCLSSTQHKGSDGRKLVLKEGTKWNGEECLNINVMSFVCVIQSVSHQSVMITFNQSVS